MKLRSLHHIILVAHTCFGTFQRSGLLNHHHAAANLHIFGMAVYACIQLGIG